MKSFGIRTIGLAATSYANFDWNVLSSKSPLPTEDQAAI